MHYNLNVVEAGSCAVLRDRNRHFDVLLTTPHVIEMVDAETQAKALQFACDMLGIEPIIRNAPAVCEAVTAALQVPGKLYSGAMDGIAHGEHTQEPPGCYVGSIATRDRELVFCAKEVARLGPMSSVPKDVMLSMALDGIGKDDVEVEADETDEDDECRDEQASSYPQKLGLPDYFKCLW